jgi:hypothetical protein
MSNNIVPWLTLFGGCCAWPAVVGVIGFLIGRGYRVRVEKP